MATWTRFIMFMHLDLVKKVRVKTRVSLSRWKCLTIVIRTWLRNHQTHFEFI